MGVQVCGIVQGVGTAAKYRKVLVHTDPGASVPTVTDLIAEVSTGTTFDMQVAVSGTAS